MLMLNSAAALLYMKIVIDTGTFRPLETGAV